MAVEEERRAMRMSLSFEVSWFKLQVAGEIFEVQGLWNHRDIYHYYLGTSVLGSIIWFRQRNNRCK